jgi:hypothetical protein
MDIVSCGVSAEICDVRPGFVGAVKGTGLISAYCVGDMMAQKCPWLPSP